MNKLSAHRRRSMALPALVAILGFLYACHLTQPQDERRVFSFPSLAGQIRGADFVSITLKDSTGRILEVLYDGPVDPTSSFLRLETRVYQGGKVHLEIIAKRDGQVVYREMRIFDGDAGGVVGTTVYQSHLASVRISRNAAIPRAGKHAPLPPVEVLPGMLADRRILWISRDTTILQVRADSLHALLPGPTVLVALLVADSSKRDSLPVQILAGGDDGPPVSVDSVRFLADSLDVIAGGSSESLPVQVHPSRANPVVRFTVREASIARIVGDKVQGLAEGETWVMAASVEDSSKVDSLRIIVLPSEQVDSLRLRQDSLKLYVNGENETLIAALHPPTLKPRFQWRSADARVASVDAAGRVSPRGPGKAYITVVARADSTRRDSALVTVKKDVPVVKTGGDTVVSAGTTLEHLILVSQEYGAVVLFRWDLDGDGSFEDSSATVPHILTHTYNQAKDYEVRFYVRDTEGNDIVHIRRVKAVIGRAVQIISPKHGSYTRESILPVTWTVDGREQTSSESLVPGANSVTRSVRDSSGMIYSDSITVHLDQTPPHRPEMIGPSASVNTLTPTWKWRSGGGGGNGIFRYRIDNPDLGTAPITRDTFHTAPTNLASGTHTLYVEERDEAGNWSPTGSGAIRIDTTAPPAPTVTIASGSPTKVPRPTWNWTAGGKDIYPHYRFKLGDDDFRSGGRDTTSTSYQPPSPLPEGSHTLYVQVRDSAGNWSPSGSATVVVDLTPPPPPMVTVAAPLTKDATPTWTWSTTTSGTPAFRYRLDNSDLSQGATETTAKDFTPSSGLSEGTHTLYVQERDAAGNWSPSGSRPVRVDVTSPGPPRIDSTPYSPLNSLRPRWTWRSGTEGAKVFRARVDTANLEGAEERRDSAYAPGGNLPEGAHTLYVQERDSAGNWSGVSSRRIFIANSGTVGPAGFGTGNRASIAVSNTGTPYVAYLSGRDHAANETGVPVIKKFNGVAWEDLPSIHEFYVNHIQIRVDRNGIPYVAVAHPSASSWSFKILRLAGLEWENMDAPYLIRSDGEFDFEIGVDGSLFLAFKNNLEPIDEVLSLIRFRNGKWDSMGADLPCNGRFSAGFSTNGNAVVAITDRSDHKVRVWNLTNGQWAQPEIIGPAFASAVPSIAMDNAGNSYLSYLEDPTSSTGIKVIRNSGSGWQPFDNPSLLKRPGEYTEKSAALRLDASGVPHLGWGSIWRSIDSEWKAMGKPLSFKPWSRGSFAMTPEGVVYMAISDEYDGPISVLKTSFDP